MRESVDVDRSKIIESGNQVSMSLSQKGKYMHLITTVLSLCEIVSVDNAAWFLANSRRLMLKS